MYYYSYFVVPFSVVLKIVNHSYLCNGIHTSGVWLYAPSQCHVSLKIFVEGCVGRKSCVFIAIRAATNHAILCLIVHGESESLCHRAAVFVEDNEFYLLEWSTCITVYLCRAISHAVLLWVAVGILYVYVYWFKERLHLLVVSSECLVKGDIQVTLVSSCEHNLCSKLRGEEVEELTYETCSIVRASIITKREVQDSWLVGFDAVAS